jgi:hypothetical protein
MVRTHGLSCRWLWVRVQENFFGFSYPQNNSGILYGTKSLEYFSSPPHWPEFCCKLTIVFFVSWLWNLSSAAVQKQDLGLACTKLKPWAEFKLDLSSCSFRQMSDFAVCFPHLQGTGSGDRIQIFVNKLTVLVKIKISPGFQILNVPLMRCRHCHFSHGFLYNMWKHIWGITFRYTVCTEFLCGPRWFRMVQCINF